MFIRLRECARCCRRPSACPARVSGAKEQQDSGGAWLRQGARLVSPAYVGDVLELGGFENQMLNTTFTLCKAEGLQNEKPVYQSRNKELMLSCAVTVEGKVWIAAWHEASFKASFKASFLGKECEVSVDEKFQQVKNQGTPPEGAWPDHEAYKCAGWPLKRLGALLVSPVGATLLEAPQLNWQELPSSRQAAKH